MTVAVVTSSLFQPLDNDPPYEIVRPFVYASAEPKAKKAMRLAMALEPARDFLERFAPDIVHAQGTVLPVIERFLYRGLGAVTVCTVHDARAHERRPWLGSFSGFYGGFDWLICHSESTRHKGRAARGCGPLGICSSAPVKNSPPSPPPPMWWPCPTSTPRTAAPSSWPRALANRWS